MASSPRVNYCQGDHVCTLFSTPEEQLQAAVDYIAGGLSRSERCLYVCCEHELSDFRKALRKAGIDVKAEEQRGALLLLSKHDYYFKGGKVDPDNMIEILRAAVEQALAEGFSGLCAAGDMTWLLEDFPGSETAAEYEARLNSFFKNNRAVGLCQYNRNKLPDAALDNALATHPYIRWDGPILLENPFFEPPEQAAKRPALPNEGKRKIRLLEQGFAGFDAETATA